MKLTFFNDDQLGVLTEGGIVDINDALSAISYHTPQELIRMVIEDFDNLRPKIEDTVENGTATALDSVSLKAPVTPAQVNSSVSQGTTLSQIAHLAVSSTLS